MIREVFIPFEEQNTSICITKNPVSLYRKQAKCLCILDIQDL